MEETLDLGYIITRIKNVLRRQHGDSRKHDVKCYPDDSSTDRVNFACPHCGDSEKHANKKRANFYVDNAMVKCFNCGYRRSITSFFDQFGEVIGIDEKMQLYKYIDSAVRYTRKNDDMIMSSLDKLIPIDDFCEFFNNKKDSWLYNIRPVTEGSQVFNYLVNDRLITDFTGIYEGIYRVVRDGRLKFSAPVLINMNTGGGKLLGIQLRNLEGGDSRFYKIVEFSELYDYMHPDEKLDPVEAISYNKLSHFYNILNVDFDREINIFEGYLDSKFSPNSIGLVGLNSGSDLINFLVDSGDDLKLRFFYDNDAPGIRVATRMMSAGFPVFLWNKLFSSMVEKMGNKYWALPMLKRIKDLNALVLATRDPSAYRTLKLDDFFSVDEFDLMYMDKLVYDKVNRVWRLASDC